MEPLSLCDAANAHEISLQILVATQIRQPLEATLHMKMPHIGPGSCKNRACSIGRQVIIGDQTSQ